MIKMYTGTPGSGKSLHITRDILFNLRSGKLVISNYPILFKAKEIKKGYQDRFFYVPEDRITVSNLMHFASVQGMLDAKKEGQCLIVIDEAGGRFNCREYGKSDRMEWIKFMSQHRKFGFDLTMAAQNDRMLDRQIRAMCEVEIKHRKAENMYWWFKLSPLKLFVSIEYHYATKLRQGVEFFTYHKSLGERYDSMKLFEELNISDWSLDTGAGAGALFSL